MFKNAILKMAFWNSLGKLHSPAPPPRLSPSLASSCSFSYIPLHDLRDVSGLELAHSHAAPGTALIQQLGKRASENCFVY